MNNNKTSVDIWKSKLSFAVRLIDDYTDKIPLGNVKVYLQDEPGTVATLNRNGYHLFTDLTKAQHRIVVKSEYYFVEEKRVNVNQLDSKSPVVELKIKPNPYYPFPSTATLIRGTLKDMEGNRITDSKARIKRQGINVSTNEKGDFVIYIKT